MFTHGTYTNVINQKQTGYDLSEMKFIPTHQSSHNVPRRPCQIVMSCSFGDPTRDVSHMQGYVI